MFTWNIGSLLNGDSVQCNVLVTVEDYADTFNDAAISGAVTDPNPGNNTGSAQIIELAPAIPAMSFGGMLLMIMLLAGIGVFVLRRFV